MILFVNSNNRKVYILHLKVIFMINRNLEGKLKAIQELKREKYVGTQSAWNYIKGVTALYENPLRISKAINERLEEQGTVYYPASPERIVGLGYYLPRFFTKIELESSDQKEPDEFTEEDYAILYLTDIPLFSCIELITDKKENRNIEKLVDYLFPLFLESQSESMTNLDFAIKAIQYPEEIHQINEVFRNAIYSKVSSSNWDNLFSLDNLRSLETKIKRDIFSYEILINDRVKLMMNDRVDHRLEYRREILTDTIDEFINCTFFGESNVVSYDSLRDHYVRNLRESRKRLEKLECLNTPDCIIKSEKLNIEKKEFILCIIAPEKNFIDRYLRS